MKYLYLVDYWVPFPSSEYGGIINVIAKNDQECYDLLAESKDYDSRYVSKIMEQVSTAAKFALVDEEQSRIVDSFTT